MNAGKTKPKTKAMAIDRFGGIDELKLQSRDIPEIGPDEVLINLKWAGVAKWDPFEREGGFVEMMSHEPKFPYVLGSDGSGIITAVGNNVERFKVGDEVCATALVNAKGGFYAEYIVLNTDTVSRVPKNLSLEQAGVFMSDALTAYRGLREILNIKPGESVMIFGASGGLGHFAVQLAKRMEAQVFAVASGEDGVQLAKKIGADKAVDGHKADVTEAAHEFAPNGIDFALMAAGGEKADKALKGIKDKGKVAWPNGVMPEPNVPENLIAENYDGMPAINQKGIEELNQLIEAGPFEVHVAQVFPLGKAAEAHKALEEHYLGKIVLKID